LLAGSVIIETIFTLPGVGRLVLDSIRQRDFVLLQGAMVIIAGVFLTTNLLVDLLYAYLDPRIRYR
ncbi:MAG: ABC transporter permease subunit, partial [Chloroflexota bacterium]